MEHYGILSFVPTIVVVLLALMFRKTFEALVAGSIVGFLILAKLGFFDAFTDTMLKVMSDSTIGWIILVCGLFGSLIHLLVKSGGASAFADFLLRFVKNRRSALIVTWLLGLSIFIDDYLNALTVGSSMKKVTDKFKIPRELLAYIVDSTAAPICVLIPLSTWAIFIAGLLESEGLAEAGRGLQAYLLAIPFIIYAWVAALLVPMVAMGWVPPLGAMREAEARAKNGVLIPPGSEAISIKISEANPGDFKDGARRMPKIIHFVLPILVLIAATVYFEVDALKGIICAVFFTIGYYLIDNVMPFSKAMEEVFSGIKTMLFAMAIVIMSFVLKEVNDQLGLTNYIIELVSPWLNKAMLPAIAFVALGIITFSTGSFWGVYAIALPIIIPLAQSLEVNIWLSVGAVISAGAFGSHACFYGDATVLSASATGCNNMAHAMTQLPYALLAGAISFLIYLILGFTM